jgi:large subunit ribosomal protein L35Ae
MSDAKTYSAPQKRLYAKGKIMGYQRNHHYQRRGTSIVRIEGVTSAADTEFYHGKRIAFVYNAKVAKPCKGHHEGTSKVRVIWGKVTRAHGTSGAVRAQFRVNLPAKAFGASVRVMLTKLFDTFFAK